MAKTVNTEYQRLKSLFDNIDESKTELIDELLRKAAFLKIELDKMEKDIAKDGIIEINDKGVVKISTYYKAYLQTVAVYQGIIKTLNTIMGKQVKVDDDDFDEFMKKSEGK